MEFIGDRVLLGNDTPTAFGMGRDFPISEGHQRAGLLYAFAKAMERQAESLAQSQLGVDREQAETFVARAAGMYAASEQLQELLQELSPEEIVFRNYIGLGIRHAEAFANNANS